MPALKYRDPADGQWKTLPAPAALKHSALTGLDADDHPQYLQTTGGTVTGPTIMQEPPVTGTIIAAGTIDAINTAVVQSQPLDPPPDGAIRKDWAERNRKTEVALGDTFVVSGDYDLVFLGLVDGGPRMVPPFDVITIGTVNTGQAIWRTAFTDLPNMWRTARSIKFTLTEPAMIRFDYASWINATGTANSQSVEVALMIDGNQPSDEEIGQRLKLECVIAGRTYYETRAASRTVILGRGAHTVKLVAKVSSTNFSYAYANYTNLSAVFVRYTADAVLLNVTKNEWDRVSLKWQVTAGTPTSTKVYRNGSLIAGAATGTTYNDTGLNASTSYTYRIEAYKDTELLGAQETSVTTPAKAAIPFTATTASSSQINLAWTDPTPGSADAYRVYRNNGHVHTAAAAARSWSDTGLAASTNYGYRLEPYRSGVKLLPNPTASATTSAPPLQQRVWEGWAVESASYNGSNQRRTDSDGLTRCYYGHYSSTHGTQHSQVRFAIPGEIRNCVSVDVVEIRWWNQHHFLNSGGRVSMVAHHNTSLTTYGGSTSVLLDGGNQVRWSVGKPGWINGTEWYYLHWLTSSGRPSIAEEIRVHGLQGFGLVQADGGQNGYGYASTDALLKITYTVRVG